MRPLTDAIRITKRHFNERGDFYIVEAFGHFSDLPHSKTLPSWHNLSGDIDLAAFAVQFAEDSARVTKKLDDIHIRLQRPTLTLNCPACASDFTLDKPFVLATESVVCSGCKESKAAQDWIRPQYFS